MISQSAGFYMFFFFVCIPLIFLVLVFWGINKLLTRWIVNRIIRNGISLISALVATMCIYPFMFPLMVTVTDLIRYGYISNY